MDNPKYKDLFEAKIFLDSIDYNLFNWKPISTLYSLIKSEEDSRDRIRDILNTTKETVGDTLGLGS